MSETKQPRPRPMATPETLSNGGYTEEGHDRRKYMHIKDMKDYKHPMDNRRPASDYTEPVIPEEGDYEHPMDGRLKDMTERTDNVVPLNPDQASEKSSTQEAA